MTYRFRQLSSVAVLVVSLPVACWGQSNQAYLLQDSTGSATGNTIFIDQSQASFSRVGTGVEEPLRQIGAGNEGSITLTGEGAFVAFQQLGEPGAGFNSATIEAGADASVLLEQDGIWNTGTIEVGDGGNTGQLIQTGNDNIGSVKVYGSGNTGRLEQDGNENEYAIEVGGVDTTLVFRQIGNGLEPADPGTPYQLISNGATVIVTVSN